MNELHRGIITLLRSAITGERLTLPEGFQLDAAWEQVRRHHMPTLIYQGAVNCGVAEDHPVMLKLFQAYCKALAVSERQMQMAKRLFAAFEQHGIDYMPLKGCIMKALYPKPEMRMMGDADVLIREEQYPQIIGILQELGFTGGADEGHDYAWNSSQLHLEVHKMIMDPKGGEWSAYFGTGWDFARQAEGTRYEMSPEDTFVFHFAHFAKHFGYAGIGCRHVVDLWVYLRAHPALDQDYVLRCLKQIRLDRFYLYIRDLLDVWFADGTPGERTEYMTGYIMANGSWGNVENAAVASGIRKNGADAAPGKMRFKALLGWMYPGAEVLRKEYPVLQKAPVLLPAIVCVRLVRKVFSRDVRKSKLRALSALNQKNIDQRREMQRYLGLAREE